VLFLVSISWHKSWYKKLIFLRLPRNNIFHQWNNVPMWIHRCVITLIEISYSISSVVPVTQLFRCDTTAILIVALMAVHQQVRSQVLRWKFLSTIYFVTMRLPFHATFGDVASWSNDWTDWKQEVAKVARFVEFEAHEYLLKYNKIFSGLKVKTFGEAQNCLGDNWSQISS